MGIRDILRVYFGNSIRSVQLQAEMREGIANQANLINDRLMELIKLQTDHAVRSEQLLRELVTGVANQTDVLNRRLDEIVKFCKR